MIYKYFATYFFFTKRTRPVATGIKNNIPVNVEQAKTNIKTPCVGFSGIKELTFAAIYVIYANKRDTIPNIEYKIMFCFVFIFYYHNRN